MKIKHILLALTATLALGTFAADKLVTSRDDGSVIERYVDQGDGTWAKVLSGGTGAISQQVQGNSASGVADVGNPVKVGGKYVAGGVTLADGQRSDLQLDSAGRLVIVSGSSGAGANQVQGNISAGVADAGNPVKIGGFGSSGAPTAVTVGQRVNAWMTLNCAQVIAGVIQTTGTDSFANNSVALTGSVSGNNYMPISAQYIFNGTTWDRSRGNIDTAALITATGATTTQTGADQTNYNGRCVTAVLDMTTVGTGSVTLTIQGKDAASGKYYTLLAGAAVVTNSTNVYTVCPGATVTANVSANAPLPRTWRVLATANNANATTYTVGASITN